MKYVSDVTPNGNIGVSYTSQEIADALARKLDSLGYKNYYNTANVLYAS